MRTGRFVPCVRCGLSPAHHNPHPLNDGYVGHEYAATLPVIGSIRREPLPSDAEVREMLRNDRELMRDEHLR